MIHLVRSEWSADSNANDKIIIARFLALYFSLYNNKSIFSLK